MPEDVIHYLFRILAGAGLQEMVPCGDFGVCGQVLPGINHLYLVDPFQYHRGVLLGRASHPVDAVGQGACAVRLDTDLFPRLT